MAALDSTSGLIYENEFIKDGYIFEKDAGTGQQVEEMEANLIPFASEAGLQFYKSNVLDDKVFTVWYLCFPTRANNVKAQTTGP